MMKTMPQINVMSIGFALKIISGTLVLALAIFAINDAIGDHIRDVIGLIEGWAAGL